MWQYYFVYSSADFSANSVTLKLGPIKSAADQSDPALLSQLSPAAEQQVVSALTVLKDITSYYMYDGLQQQLIYDAGVLPALHYILRRKEEIQNPEIMTLGCQIVANLLRSPDGDTKKNDLARGDFVDALVELIEYVRLWALVTLDLSDSVSARQVPRLRRMRCLPFEP